MQKKRLGASIFLLAVAATDLSMAGPWPIWQDKKPSCFLILPVGDKSSPNQPDFRVLSQGIEIGAGWLRTGQTSGKEYVSLSISAPEFGARTLYANLGRAAGQSDENVYALIWNPQD